MSEGKRDVTVHLKTAELKASAGSVTVWRSDNFAQDWFTDALQEARDGRGHNARRREIIFAMCFAESYIFEWVRGIVPIDQMNNYFPPDKLLSVMAKWAKIPSNLFKNGKIPTDPRLDLSSLDSLRNCRNGLVHARASRPAKSGQPEGEKPFPTKDILREEDPSRPGWAVKIVVDLVSKLHQAVGTSPPDYIEYP